MNKSKVLAILVYGVAIFGIIDAIPKGLKDTPRAIYIIVLYSTFILRLAIKKRSVVADVILLFVVLLSSVGFSNFLIDLFFHPKTIAEDCQGHHYMQMHWVKGFLVGPLLTISLGYYFLKNRITYYQLDKVFSIVALIVLTLCTLQIPIAINTNKIIDKVSKPELVLPPGC